MDNSIILVLSQALLYLKDPRVEQANKQLLKRKLASELVSVVEGNWRRNISPCTLGVFAALYSCNKTVMGGFMKYLTRNYKVSSMIT